MNDATNPTQVGKRNPAEAKDLLKGSQGRGYIDLRSGSMNGIHNISPFARKDMNEVAIVDLSVIAYCMDGIAKHIHKGIPKQVDIGHFLGVTICLSYAVLLGIKVAVTTQYTNDENCLSS